MGSKQAMCAIESLAVFTNSCQCCHWLPVALQCHWHCSASGVSVEKKRTFTLPPVLLVLVACNHEQG